MRGTQIRWPNVAKLAGGVGLGATLLFAVPALLDAPDPPALEPDIGLAPSPTSVPEPGAIPEPAPTAVRPKDAGERGRSRSRSARVRESKANRTSPEEESVPAPGPMVGPVPTTSPGTVQVPPSATGLPTPRPNTLPALIREFGL